MDMIFTNFHKTFRDAREERFWKLSGKLRTLGMIRFNSINYQEALSPQLKKSKLSPASYKSCVKLSLLNLPECYSYFSTFNKILKTRKLFVYSVFIINLLKLCKKVVFYFVPILYALRLQENLELQKQINIKSQSLLSQCLTRLYHTLKIVLKYVCCAFKKVQMWCLLNEARYLQEFGKTSSRTMILMKNIYLVQFVQDVGKFFLKLKKERKQIMIYLTPLIFPKIFLQL